MLGNKLCFVQLVASTDNIYDAVAARYGHNTGALGFRQNSAALAGNVAIPKKKRGKWKYLGDTNVRY